MTGNVSRYHNLIEALEAAPGDRDFVTHWIDEEERETISFGAFRSRASAHAQLLHEAGVAAGDRVIVILPQSIAAMAVFAGAMMLGAVPAFLAYPNFKVEPSKYRAGLAGVTANLGATVVVIDRDFPDEFLEHISVGDKATILRASEESLTPGQVGLPGIEISGENIAFIQHSAGTTGLQKGVALTHAAVLRQIEHLQNVLAIHSESDRVFSWLPLYHDMGLIACFLLPMVGHIPVVMQSPLEWVMRPETMLQVISECKCTLSWMPNFAFQFVPRRTPQSRRGKYDLASLRAVINCSEPVRAGSMREFEQAFSSSGLKERVLRASYAMAENVFAVTQSIGRPAEIWADSRRFRSDHVIDRLPPGTTGAVSFTSSGQLLPGNTMQIVDDTGGPLEAGCVGEIQIRSDSLFRGYYNRPDLTEATFAGEWYRTGDLGFTIDGELFVVGRKKDLLIVGGENLYPQDIEEIVANHPAVHDGRAVAIGVYNPDLGTEDVVIVAEVEQEQQLADAASIEQEIRNLVVAGTGVAARRIYLKPPKWIVKSTAGKPARAATREKLLREHPELEQEKST